jgi:hypothetical protein
VADGYGWAGSASAFCSLTEAQLLDALEAHHRDLWGTRASTSQKAAWRTEYAVLQDAFRACALALPEVAPDWGVVFEYEMPLEGGRRPDIVVLAGRSLVVLEFKSASLPSQADVDQVAAYARDLVDYHAASHDLVPRPMLVLTGAPPGFARVHDEVVLTAPEGLHHYLFDAYEPGGVNLDTWVHAAYHPLPSLVEAARRIFRHEPLPHVKRALAAGVPETVELLGSLVDAAADTGERLLAFVTGVPGSGKTLVGLRLVYERSSATERATFLSGNGPLVAVLQDALRSRVFVRDLHAFIRTYALRSRPATPDEHVIVFDEAQRAWDRAYMAAKRRIGASEPELLVRIGERIAGWAALVGLVGEGQEIHSGEEGGLEQWREAASPPNAARHWVVHCPPKLAGTFAGMTVRTHERLDLTMSLRSRRAERYHDWVQLLLNGAISLAARRATRIQADGYPMYVTRDLEEARAYVRARYDGETGKRYGLVASSHAKRLRDFGVDNGYLATSRMNIAAWYNAPPDDPRSSCALTQPVTEFGCQGLELDLPVVCWGEDLRWHHGVWLLTPVRRRHRQDDPEQLLRNAYRVLLTRGRDGVVVFVPPLPLLDETEHILLAAGLKPIPEPAALAAPEAAG